MPQLSRRSVLRAGAGFVFMTMAAGCMGDSNNNSTTSNGIPGVEDGNVVDNNAFATAHSDQLATRSGTLEWARMSLDPETGDPEINSIWTVRVEDNRVHAVVIGRASFSGAEDDRLEFYYEDDTTFYRTGTDGEGKTGSSEQPSVSRGTFTGRSDLEVATLHREGTETIDDQELSRFSNVERDAENGQTKWTSIQAFVDENALVHSFQQTVDSTNTRRFDEWHVTELDSTTIERPKWVEG